MSVVTVSQLNSYIKKYIDLNSELSTVWVKGEISNYKKHYSGHIYLTLKDANSTLKVVIFKSVASSVNIELKDGMNVLVCGRISVYEQGGTYQLYANSVIIDGIGELYKAYEKLKNELYKKGLFDSKYKKVIPSKVEAEAVIILSSFFILMWHITVIKLCMSNHFFIPRINPTFS